MRMRGLLAIALLSFATIPATAALDPEVVTLARRFLFDFGPYWTIDLTNDRSQIASLTGRPSDTTPSPDAVATQLFNRFIAFRDLSTTVFAPMSISDFGDVREYLWQQTIGSDPIDNAYVLITFHRGSGLYDAILNHVPQQSKPGQVRSPAQARTIAMLAFRREIEVEASVNDRRSFFLDVPVVEATLPKSTDLLAVGEKVHLVFLVTVTARARDNNVLLAMREYAIDLSVTSDLLDELVVRSRDLMPRSVTGKTRIFDPNPANALNNGSLQIQDVTNSSSAYTPADLLNLDMASGGRYFMSGPHIQIVNLEKPNDSPPAVADDGSRRPQFLFFRGSSDFAAAMTYVHVERMQRHVEDIGLSDLVQKPLIADIYVQASSSELNAGYIHRAPAPGYLWFSRTNGIYAAEDADVIAHEHGHALLSQKSKGRFDIIRSVQHPLSEATSVAEGFSDYWALSSTYVATVTNRSTLDCFAEWAATTQQCFRTYTKKPSYKTYFDQRIGVDGHKNAEVWSGMLFDVFKLLRSVDAADFLILRGHLNRMFKRDAPTISDMADGILIADAQQKGGHHDDLCDLFEMHAVSPACCVKNGCSADLTRPAPPLPVELQ